jgi:hypothetical protein
MGFFREHGHPAPSEMLPRIGGEDDVVFPQRLAPDLLLVTGTAMAFQAAGIDAATVDETLPRKAQALCFHASAETRWPQGMWMHDPGLKANSLGSFVGSPRANLLTRLLGAKSAAELSSERLLRELEGVISALEENAQQEPSWALLGALLANQRCPVALQKRLLALFVRVPWTLLIANDPIRFVVMHAFATHAWQLGGHEFANLVQEKIVAEARRLSRLQMDEAKTLEQAKYVMGSVEVLTKSAPPEEAPRTFSNGFVACLAEWPALASCLPGAVGQMLMLPDNQLVNTWPLILRLRHDSPPKQAASSPPGMERGSEAAE